LVVWGLAPHEIHSLVGCSSDIAILRQLECVMADSAQPYDELAAYYDQMFQDWEATILRQAMVLGGILHLVW
jgi:hypothetical protein